MMLRTTSNSINEKALRLLNNFPLRPPTLIMGNIRTILMQ